MNGKVSPKIVKVEVTHENDEPFALSKFEAGSGEWSYNASTEWENLAIGINNYSVVGYDEDGNTTPIANFQIIYNPEGVEELVEENEAANAENDEITETDGVPPVGGTTFAAPVVNEPTDGATFAEAPIHFEGTVPVGTSQVLVNEYALSSFEAGATEWRYNADPKYDNLEEGENE